MTFLKKLGGFLAKAVQIAVGVGPIILPFIGSSKTAQIATAAVNDFTAVGQTILTVEAAFQGQGTGAQKLAAAVPLVSGIVKTSELVAGKKIANESLFTQGCEKITNGMVDVLNSIHPDAAQTA